MILNTVDSKAFDKEMASKAAALKTASSGRTKVVIALEHNWRKQEFLVNAQWDNEAGDITKTIMALINADFGGETGKIFPIFVTMGRG